MNKKKQYVSLNGLRAYAAIAIVLLHVLANLPYEYEGFIFQYLIPSFSNLVLLFMIISSFSMCCGYYEKVKNNKILINDFYRNRFSKIFPFFVFVSLLDTITNLNIKTLSEFFANSTLVFGLLPNIGFEVIGVGWFLGVVFVFYMLFPFFCYLIWEKKRAWLSMLIAIIYHILCVNIFKAPRTNILFCAPFFVLGGILYLYKNEIEQLFSIKKIRLISLISIPIIYFIYLNTNQLLILLVLFAIFVCLAVGKDSYAMNNFFTKLISNNSLEIYLCHMVVFRIIMLIGVNKITDNIYLVFILISILVLISALLTSIIFNFLLKKLQWRIKKWQRKN